MLRNLSLGLLGMMMLAGTAWAGDWPRTPAGRLVAEDRVLVIAHRGDSKAAPENTIPAFESAVRVGSDLVELDYVHTSEGIPIVIHDDTLDRTTNADEIGMTKKIAVASQTLAELQTYDAGAWFDAQFAGTKLPTLEESLDVIQNGSVTLIERKAGDAKTCIDLLERKEMVGDVVVQSFDWSYVADCRKLRPDLVLCALGSGHLTEERLDEIEETGAQLVGWQFLSLKKTDVEAIHERGMKVWVWTVDDPKGWARMIEWGVDGIITNLPAKTKAAIADSTVPAKQPAASSP